jgi:hypothetical protein
MCACCAVYRTLCYFTSRSAVVSKLSSMAFATVPHARSPRSLLRGDHATAADLLACVSRVPRKKMVLLVCWHDKMVQSCNLSRKQAPRNFMGTTIVVYKCLSTTFEHMGRGQNVGALETCEDIHGKDGKVTGAIKATHWSYYEIPPSYKLLSRLSVAGSTSISSEPAAPRFLVRV